VGGALAREQGAKSDGAHGAQEGRVAAEQEPDATSQAIRLSSR